MSFFWIISLLFTVVFAMIGPFVQFFPLFLSHKGFGTSQIAVAMSCLAISKIISSIAVAFFIDRSPRPHLYLALAGGFYAFIWLIIMLFDMGGNHLIQLIFIFSLAGATILPLTEGFSVRACRLKPDLDYGRMRLFGSAAFVMSGFLCGLLIDKFSLDIVPLYIIVASTCIAFLALKMPNFYDIERKNHIELPTTNFDVVKKLMTHKNFLLIVFGASIMHAGHALMLQSGAVDWQKSGYSGEIISLFFAIGVVAEIILFYFGSSLEKNFTITGFFCIAAFASAARWTGMAFEPNFYTMILLQSLHGLTFGALHLGCIRYFKENLPDGTLGAAQLIYGAVMWGVVMIPVTIMCGYLHEIYAAKAYLAMVVLVFIGLATILSVKKNTMPIVVA